MLSVPPFLRAGFCMLYQLPLLRSDPPGWRGRFGRHPVYRICLKHSHAFLDGTFELRVVTGDHVLWPVFDIDVGRNTGIFDRPFPVLTKETSARCDRRAAVDEKRRVGRMDETAPSPFAHERADLAELEHIRHEVAARAGHLVDDHHLWPPDSGRRRSKRISVAGDIIKVAAKIALQNIDYVIRRRASAVVAFVDDGSLLVLLREVISVEAGVTGLAGIRQVDVSELSSGKLVY